ncbi:hypothetical protein PHYPO_G00076270 [Pangasianodon hypophthalmus]|uniref:EF-hand domain-containing protein n=1 Tax=Pangasianodon hypophthalmus TaxID=310915 RepID=A0A5N5LKG5_PANHP|nr:hypothetical protein PHYPO_G00076270 [Pangasianodon hypophthalmus]
MSKKLEYIKHKKRFSCVSSSVLQTGREQEAPHNGRLNVGNDELDEMLKEAPGPINFTIFLSMFGEKLKGTDPEENILAAFKIFDPEGTGIIKGEEIKYHLMSQADKFTEAEVNQMFTNFPLDVAGNLDYKNLCYVITHGEDKEQE